jgi:hypothetical protein
MLLDPSSGHDEIMLQLLLDQHQGLGSDWNENFGHRPWEWNNLNLIHEKEERISPKSNGREWELSGSPT